MSTNSTENLLRKIRALRAKAEDPSVTEAEAATYAAKVAELLQQHNLSESALDIEDQEEITSEEWRLDYGGDSWRRSICHQAALLYFCEGFVDHYKDPKNGKWRNSYKFVGRPHNIIVAREMAHYLIETTLRLGRAWYTERLETDPEASRSLFTNFLRACGLRLSWRLQEKRTEQTSPAPLRSASGNPANLPALYEDENTLLKRFMEEKMKLDLKPTRHRRTSGEGARAGRAAADTVSLSAQIGRASGARLLS